MDRSFLHISEVGPVCNEVSVRVELVYWSASIIDLFVPYGYHIVVEEFSEGSCAEAALQPEGAWGKNMVRLCIARQTNDQVSSRVDELTASGFYHRTYRSVTPDRVRDLVGGGFRVRLCYIEPKLIEGGRLCIVFVG